MVWDEQGEICHEVGGGVCKKYSIVTFGTLLINSSRMVQGWIVKFGGGQGDKFGAGLGKSKGKYTMRLLGLCLRNFEEMEDQDVWFMSV